MHHTRIVALVGMCASVLTLAAASTRSGSRQDSPPRPAAREPEIVLPRYSPSQATGIAVSADGTWFATGSRDRTIGIWSLPDGGHLRTMAMPAAVTAVALHPTLRLAAVGLDDGAVRLVDVARATDLGAPIAAGSSVLALAWSPSGDRLAALGNVRLLMIDRASWTTSWEASAGRREFNWSGVSGRQLAFSSDGSVLFAAGRNVTSWRARDGAGIATFVGHSAPVTCVWYDAARERLVTASQDRTVRVWHPTSGEPDGPALEAPGPVLYLSFSPTLSRLLAMWRIGDLDEEGLVAWSWPDRKTAGTLSGDLEQGALGPMEVTPDGQTLLVAGFSMLFLDPRDFSTRAVKTSEYGSLTPHFSSGGRMLLFPTPGSSVWMIDGDVRAVDYSTDGDGPLENWLPIADGSAVFASGPLSAPGGAAKSILQIFSHESFGPTLQLERTGSIQGLSSSTTGQVLAWIEQDVDLSKPVPSLADTVRFEQWLNEPKRFRVVWWDAVRRREKKVYRTGVDFPDRALAGPLALSPDGGRLAYAVSGRIHLSADGRERDVELPRQDLPVFVSHLLPFRDGSHVVAVDYTGRVFVIAWTSGRIEQRHRIGRPTPRGTREITAVALGPADAFLVAAGDDQVVRRQQLGDEAPPAQELFRSGAEVRSLAVSPDGGLLALGLREMGVTLWSLADRQLRLNFFAECPSPPAACKWLAASPSGLFESAGDLWTRVRWRFDGDTFDSVPVGALLNDFYRPGLIQEVLRDVAAAAPQIPSRAERVQPAVDITARDWDPKARVAHLRVRVDAAGRDLRLFRNGSLIRKWPGLATSDGSGEVEADVRIVDGANHFSAFAFNAAGVASTVGELRLHGDPILARPSRLHVLAVGINEYANPDLALRYARPDAELVVAELMKVQDRTRLYGSVRTILLRDREATRDRILAALAQLKRDVEPEDDVVLYFAGHGLRADKRFLFLPQDVVGDLQEPLAATMARTSVSDLDFERELETVDAARMLMALDACQAGQLLDTGDDWRRGPVNANGLAQIAFEKQMQLVTASQAYQSALEWEVLGHGLLTYAMVAEGLGEFRADVAPKDQRLTFEEWGRYAVQRVPQLQGQQVQRRGLKLTATASTAQQPKALFSNAAWSSRDAWGDPWSGAELARIDRLPDALRARLPPRAAATLVVTWSSDEAGLLKDLAALRTAFPQLGIGVVTLLAGDDLDRLRRESRLDAVFVTDEDGKLHRQIGACGKVTCYSTLLFFDRNGLLRHRLWGGRSVPILADIVKALLE